MTEQIYKTFMEAGFEREARQLSITTKGKVVPALGHYISAADNILELEKQFPDRAPNAERTQFYSSCVEKILDYARAMNKFGNTSKLLDSLSEIFHKGKIN